MERALGVKGRGRWRKAVSVGLTTVFGLALAGGAVFQDGFAVTELDLNDSGVWVTNNARLSIGRFNYNAGQLDGSLVAASAAFDVLQDGANVFSYDAAEGRLTPINPAVLQFAGPLDLGPTTRISLGGGVVAFLGSDGAEGRLWAMPAKSAASFRPDPELLPPVLEGLSANSAVTVGNDGLVHVLDPVTGQVRTLGQDDAGTWVVEADRTWSGLDPDSKPVLTAVGSVPVAWDPSGRLFLGGEPDRPVAVEGVGAQGFALSLQQPGPAADAVVYETDQALVSQPLDGGQPTARAPEPAGGQPTAPVVLDGCVYAVWSVKAAFVRDCGGDDHDLATTVPGTGSQGELRLRQNRGHVVLNQVDTGGVWLVTDMLLPVDNWDDVIANSDDGDVDEDTMQEADEEAAVERPEDNHAPEAKPDSFGLRAGRSTLLPVVENDIDDDGDLLTVALDGAAPAVGELSTVYDNSVFQIDVPADASGSTSFRYRVSDGRGGEATALVNLEVRPASVNAPPEPVRVTKLVVGSGQTASANVLVDWRDPDGDTIFLRAAAPPSSSDAVQVRPDGTLSYQDGGLTTGLKSIAVTVSDGRAEGAGEVLVEVRPPGNQKPRVRFDLVSGRVGADILVQPLSNDSDPNGQALRLVDVQEPAGLTVVKDFDRGTFTVRAEEPKTVYLRYTVTDGPSVAEGWVRVDVLAEAAPDAAPVAVPDTVLLAKGQETVAAVLANDVNPLGWPLVLTRVDAPDGSPVSVSVVDHATVKITELHEFENPVTLTYQISNGSATAQSTVTVVPVSPPEVILPPVAGDDEVRVRVGDVATVHVLDNDTHPNNVPLRLRPELSDSPDPDAQALVFTAQSTVRVHARQAPGTYTVYYQVEAVRGMAEPDTGRLTIHVVDAPKDDDNRAPRPGDIEARTVTGMPVTVSIPLDGLDPDGDSVSLVGVARAPRQGRITAVGTDSITFEPGDDTVGRAEFAYTVKDRLGAQAVGTVTVGIAARPTENHAPTANPDQVEIRPGRPVRMFVTGNDRDPDGDNVYLVADSAASADFEVVTEVDRLVFTAPLEEGDYSLTYQIVDDYDQAATGVVTVTVRADVALKKPLPRDDLVPALDVLTLAEVTVDVLKNDEDPDGDIKEDVLAVGAGLVAVDGVVTIPVSAEAQIIDYSLTDPDGLVGEAFIFVPGSAHAAPQLDPAAREVEVRGGESVTVELADHVLVASGKAARLTEQAKLSAWNGTASASSFTEVVFAAPLEYSGKAAISAEITDGTGPDDPDGATATVTIPVNVLPRGNLPPTFEGSALDVEAGGQATLSLAPYAADPDPADELAFSLAAPPSATGFEAQVDGGVLTVKADPDVAKGTRAQATVEVSDGHADPVAATVTITAVASKRPLARAVDDDVAEASQGRQECVAASANDYNPFADEGLALKVVAAAVETGRGTATPGCGGEGSVAVTPAADFVGSMVVRYTLEDATGDADRHVEGRIRLNVRGRPDAPTGLHIDEVGDQRVVLSWSPANNNGDPVTAYTVAGSPAYSKVCGTQTACTLEGLTNDVTYTFTVTATNTVGTSEPSVASAEARPDTFPNRPQPPTLTFGDKSLTVTWTNPGSRGSPITSYRLEISPPSATEAQVADITATTHVWTGLTNGTEYRVKVCAVNKAEGVCEPPNDSTWSQYSAGQIPAGPPQAPAAPKLKRLDPVGGQAQAEVCWTAPDGNGDAVKSYTVTESSGRAKTTPATCQTFDVPADGTDLTYTVTASNKAGAGPASPPSAVFRAFVPPGAPGAATTTDGDRQCQVSFGAAPLNGARSGEVTYVYTRNDGAEGSFGANTGGTVTGLSNGSNYTFTIRAHTQIPGETAVDGPAVTSTTCRPYGKPNAPGAGAWAEGAKGVRLSWSKPSANGRDLVEMQVRIDDGDWTSVAVADGNAYRETGYSTRHWVQVKVKDAAGQWSAEGFAEAWSAAEPRWVNITQTGDSTATITWAGIHGSHNIEIFKNGVKTGCVFSEGTTEQCLTKYNTDEQSSVHPGSWRTANGQTVFIRIDGVQSNTITWRRPW
jgi:hypothetical protein